MHEGEYCAWTVRPVDKITTVHSHTQASTRSSADADKLARRVLVEVSQGHQTWYHSIC